MKTILAIFMLAGSLTHADCPSLPVKINFSKFTFDVPRMEGDYNVTYDFPNLIEQKCEINQFQNLTSYSFDLKNNPIVVTIKLNGKIVQTDRVPWIYMNSTPSESYFLINLPPSEKLNQGVQSFNYDKTTGEVTKISQYNFKVYTR